MKNRNTMAKALTLVCLLAGVALAATAAVISANPMTLTSPKPLALDEPKAPVTTSHVVQLDDVLIVGNAAKPEPEHPDLRGGPGAAFRKQQPKVKPAPCVDGQRRIIGFEGDPSHPSKYLGVTLNCPH
jgi:hypothetical protein